MIYALALFALIVTAYAILLTKGVIALASEHKTVTKERDELSAVTDAFKNVIEQQNEVISTYEAETRAYRNRYGPLKVQEEWPECLN